MKQSPVKINKGIEELSFIISPPPHIKSDVSVLKDDVQYLTGYTFENRYSVAHISLFQFDDKQHFQDIIREVELKSFTFNPFNIFIKGLNFFEDGPYKTIYLEILDKHLLSNLFEKLVKENTGYTPYMSIAKKLNEDQFSEAWRYLGDFHYSQHFVCDRITVLAKVGNKWMYYKDLMFGG